MKNNTIKERKRRGRGYLSLVMILVLILTWSCHCFASEVPANEVQGSDLILVIDNSGSVSAQGDLLRERNKLSRDITNLTAGHDVRIGVVYFGDHVDYKDVLPLTDVSDIHAISSGAEGAGKVLDFLEKGREESNDDTNIGEGLKCALDLYDSTDRQRVLLLISDGRDDNKLKDKDQETKEQLAVCEAEGIPVYAVLLANADNDKKALKKIVNYYGETDYSAERLIKSKDIYVLADILGIRPDEAVMESIAESFEATQEDTEESMMETFAGELDPLKENVDAALAAETAAESMSETVKESMAESVPETITETITETVQEIYEDVQERSGSPMNSLMTLVVLVVILLVLVVLVITKKKKHKGVYAKGKAVEDHKQLMLDLDLNYKMCVQELLQAKKFRDQLQKMGDLTSPYAVLDQIQAELMTIDSNKQELRMRCDAAMKKNDSQAAADMAALCEQIRLMNRKLTSTLETIRKEEAVLQAKVSGRRS